MKLLQIYKSKPDENVQKMAAALAAAAEESHEVRLHREPVDYRQLLELIFQCNRIICWW
jgi:hypothetical protein